MQITIPVIYGIQALRLLAKGGMLTNDDIARRLDISFAYAVKVTRLLKRTGLIEATRGATGGYVLGKSLGKATVSDLIRGMDKGLLEDVKSDTADMRAIRRRLREIIKSGLEQPVSHLIT